jgi:hypothetical protein
MRFLKDHPLIPALLLSTVAEGLSVAALFLCPESSLLVWFSRSFHGPAAFFAALLFPDVIDNYASEGQEFVFCFITFAATWLQWVLIFYVGPRLYRKYECAA